jgi:VCBS repeat-containing protein
MSELEAAMRLSRIALFTLLVASMTALTACSKQEKAPSTQQQNPPAASQPSQGGQSATTATQPTNSSASPNAGQAQNGPRAADKYVLDLTNYAKVPVTIKVNGQWVGQWDNHANVPLDMVVKGENQLTVDLASQPQNTVTVNINTTRDGQGVSILSLNFQGQSGTHTATFVAR